MADVWRSVPKKFCNLCKCWFYDNRVSIEHHERGARHQENVRNKIRDTARKGREKSREDFETRKALAQMERDALKSYTKHDLAGQKIPASAHNRIANFGTAGSNSVANLEQPILKFRPGVSTIWREAVDPQTSVKYYWNSKTHETKWEQPEEGFLSVAEQEIAAQMENPNFTVEMLELSAKHSAPPLKSNSDAAVATAITSKASESPPHKKKRTTDVESAKEELEQSQSEPKKLTVAACTENSLISDVKIPMAAPMIGKWTVVEQEINRPVEAQPEEDEDEVDELEKKKIKFEERKIPLSKSSSSSKAPISFKKSAKSSGNRNLRNRGDDD
uniref:WW domain-binding protein 4 n=1 Tax=Romanomermis culicivorax TaxID=13658 RepID=A0A915HZG5_ROMCU